MFLAQRGIPPLRIMTMVLAGGGLAAGAANAFNCYFDRDLDRTMPRTCNRPLPSERLSPPQALVFALICAVTGISLLLWINLIAAALALITLVFYALVYTLWLKRSNVLSAVLSAGIGAVPPVIGWIAVTGHLAVTPFILFAIIALWTPPHFWALALGRADEYKNAGLTVLPQSKPAAWITAFIVTLVCASLILGTTAHLGNLYLAVAAILGLFYLMLSMDVVAKEEIRSALRLYRYSIVYLALLFSAMLAGLIR
jgi:protoheme IX farnesyltransferase